MKGNSLGVASTPPTIWRSARLDGGGTEYARDPFSLWVGNRGRPFRSGGQSLAICWNGILQYLFRYEWMNENHF